MTPNGLGQPQSIHDEAVEFRDLVQYWEKTVAELHARLAVAEARIASRDRTISALRGAVSNEMPVMSSPREPSPEG